MSDTRFTASNGFYVQDERVYRPDGEAWLEAHTLAAVALIEYGAHKAQAQRDAELGRWRSVEHPDWVVYPETFDHPEAVWPEPDVVRVLDELSGIHLTYRRGHPVRNRVGSMVAREYFAAHPVPEPKPWEQAQPGEVWELTTESRVDEYATILGKSMDLMTFDNVVYFMPTSEVRLPRLGLTATIITAGVRKYPEVSE